MGLVQSVPRPLRYLLQKVASAATKVHEFSIYTVELLGGPGGRATRCIQTSAGPVFEAIGNTAKRIKLTIRPEATEPYTLTTSPSRRISSIVNVAPSASLPSQTSVLHYAREKSLRNVRNTLDWLQKQQHQTEASQQMLQQIAACCPQPVHDSEHSSGTSTPIEYFPAWAPSTILAEDQTQPHYNRASQTSTRTQALNHHAVPIDAEGPEDFFNLEALQEMDCDIDTQIALHFAEAEDSVNSSDLEGFDEGDLVGFETKEEKTARKAKEHLEELKAFKAERQADLSNVKGVFPPPVIFKEKLRMVNDTTTSPESPKKTVAFYDSPKTGKPVTLTKKFNHDAPMTPPYQQHVPTNSITLVPALKRQDAPLVPEVPAHLVEQASPVNTELPLSDSDESVANISISNPPSTVSSRNTWTATLTHVASPVTDASNLVVLGTSNRRSTHRSSDLEVIAEAKREREAALAAEAARKEAERRAIKEAQRAEERTRLGIRRVPVNPVIEPLTQDWDDKVSQAMQTRLSSSTPLATTSTGEILRRRDFGHVLPQPGVDSAMGWLNDTIITAYLQAVVDYAQKSRDVRRGDLPKVHAMNTFFYDNLSQRGYDSVKRWASRSKFGGKNLLKMEKIFIPINKGGNHWVLVHINPQTKIIEYFDSFHNSPGPVEGHMRNWLRNELGDAYVDSEWTLTQKEGPEQRNASDCGVFATTTAKMIVLGVDPMAFSAKDMQTQRRRMLAELMNGGLNEDFTPNITF